MRAETDEMYEYCCNIKQNIPLDKDAFPHIDDERICSQWAFRGICFTEHYPAAL